MKIFFIFLITIILNGCNSSTAPNKKPTNYQHRNGLQFKIDLIYFSVEETNTGFQFQLSPQGGRRQNYLTIEYKPSDESDYPERRTISGKLYLYNLERKDGGSGGDAYFLKIWKPLNTGGIFIDHFRQSEIKPSFKHVWRMIKHAEIKIQN